ncbi:MAG: amidase [Bacillota bacterium]
MNISNFTIPEITNNLNKCNWEVEEVVENSFAIIGEKENLISALLPEENRKIRLEQRIEELEKNKDCFDRLKPNLYGVPVAVKDIFHVNGFRTQAGSRLDPDLLTGKEGYIIKALRSQGALILGKTVTTEFAYFVPGPTRNPHNPDHTPGGSSSGSAAAVAAGYCPLALGTQTIGSVIRPAAFCGIVGFKPSYGIIPLEGLIKFSESVDHIGFFTRTVKGMEIAFTSLSPAGQFKKAKYLPRPVLGEPDETYLKQADNVGLINFEANKLNLQKAGYEIKKTSILGKIEEINNSHRTLIAYEFTRVHEGWYKEYGEDYGRETANLIEEGLKIKEEDYLKAKNDRLKLRNRLQETMKEKGIDIFISPSAPGPAPAGIDSTGNPVMNLPWTNAGLPTITVPAGKTVEGLPLGLQMSARYEADEQLLHWARNIAVLLED